MSDRGVESGSTVGPAREKMDTGRYRALVVVKAAWKDSPEAADPERLLCQACVSLW